MHDQQSDQFDIEANGLVFTSSVLEEGGEVPPEYTCDGSGKNPPFTISGVDESAQSLVVLMEDPDAPIGTFDHWVVYNLAPDTTDLAEGTEPDADIGVSTAGDVGYYPPCPPGERHRYIWTIYALDATLDIGEGVTKQEVVDAMEGHTLQKAQITTYYER